jgi:2'-hydroxyisoflavone reductase
MEILILGGTVFLGRHIVEAAIERGHKLTLFNRGKTNPDLFPKVEKLRGDRDGEIMPLIGRSWDAVIDTCGYVPRIVQLSAEVLAEDVEHYTFISSMSVYSDFSQEGIDESSPVSTLLDETVEEVTGETYGPLKALCEAAAENAMPGRVLNIRPGLIVGPHDPTDRFTYWPWRVSRGGEVVAPAPPERRVQLIDVRDLSNWILNMVEAGAIGVYNATGPDGTLTFGEILETSRLVSESDPSPTWIPEGFLLEAGVEPWTDLPLWIPEGEIGVLSANCDKAITAGLTFRPIEETIRDTLTWDRSRPQDIERRAGLLPARESEILKAWHSQA